MNIDMMLMIENKNKTIPARDINYWTSHMTFSYNQSRTLPAQTNQLIAFIMLTEYSCSLYGPDPIHT